jgi:hypothetical protein
MKILFAALIIATVVAFCAPAGADSDWYDYIEQSEASSADAYAVYVEQAAQRVENGVASANNLGEGVAESITEVEEKLRENVRLLDTAERMESSDNDLGIAATLSIDSDEPGPEPDPEPDPEPEPEPDNNTNDTGGGGKVVINDSLP